MRKRGKVVGHSQHERECMLRDLRRQHLIFSSLKLTNMKKIALYELHNPQRVRKTCDSSFGQFVNTLTFKMFTY